MILSHNVCVDFQISSVSEPRIKANSLELTQDQAGHDSSEERAREQQQNVLELESAGMDAHSSGKDSCEEPQHSGLTLHINKAGKPMEI